MAETFPQVSSATQSGVSRAGPCELWTGGRQIVGSQILNFTAHLEPFGTTIPGDVDGDGTVGILDLLELLSAWGPCAGCAADIDGDGTVGITDLLTLLGNWN